MNKEKIEFSTTDKLVALQKLYDGNEYGMLTINNDISIELAEALINDDFILTINRNGRCANTLTIKGYKFIEDNKNLLTESVNVISEEDKEKGDTVEIDEKIAITVLRELYKQTTAITFEELNDLLLDENKVTEKDLFWLSFDLIDEIEDDVVKYRINKAGIDWYDKYLFDKYWENENGVRGYIKSVDTDFGITKEIHIETLKKISAWPRLEWGDTLNALLLPLHLRNSLLLNNYIQHFDRDSRTMDVLGAVGYKLLEDNKPDTTTIWDEQGYLNLLRRILNEGAYRKPENEEGRNELFAEVLKFDLTDYKIPVFTTKQVFIRGFFEEMMWFLKGDQDTSYLDEHKVTIWDEWKNAEGIIGPLYGYQWRHWQIDPAVRFLHPDGKTEIDQISEVLNSLKNKPEARSHMVTAWRPDHLKLMSIKPCHILLQFYRIEDKISLALYQRSH